MADKDFKVKTGLDLPAPLPVVEGGTGQTTVNNALNAMLPAQATHGSKILGTDGTNTTWVNPGAAYQTSAPNNPVTGQLWVDSDETGDSLDPYIIRRKTITATAGQTVFTTDVVFTDGYEQIYYNGVLLVRTTDYTTSGGTNTVTLLQGASAGDTVEIISSTPINLVNSATLSTNTFIGDQSISAGNLSIRVDGGKEGLFLYRGGGNANDIRLNTSQGTTNSPTASASGQLAGQIHFQAHDGTSYLGRARIGAVIDSAVSTGVVPTALTFLTGSSALIERMRIDSSGNGTVSSPMWTFSPVSGAINTSIKIRNSHFSDGSPNHLMLGVDGTMFNGVAYLDTSNGGVAAATPLVFRTSTIEAMRIDVNQNVNIGGATTINTLRYLDLFNTSTGTSAGTIIRFITNNSANTAVTTVDMVKYRNGYFGILNNDSAATIGFGTGGTERMRITNTGRVGIGLDAPRGALEVAGNILTVWSDALIGTMFADGSGYFLGIQTNVSSRFTDLVAKYADNGAIRFISGASIERARFESVNGYMLVGYTSSNGAYRLQVNSQIFATSASIATSDGRFKEEVDTISNGLAIVDSLRPVSFKWKEHPVHNFVAGKTVGFIAQEVQEALAEYDWADNIIKSNYNEETEEEFLGIAESNIIPLLVSAVKELKAEFEEYKRLHS